MKRSLLIIIMITMLPACGNVTNNNHCHPAAAYNQGFNDGVENRPNNINYSNNCQTASDTQQQYALGYRDGKIKNPSPFQLNF